MTLRERLEQTHKLLVLSLDEKWRPLASGKFESSRPPHCPFCDAPQMNGCGGCLLRFMSGGGREHSCGRIYHAWRRASYTADLLFIPNASEAVAAARAMIVYLEGLRDDVVALLHPPSDDPKWNAVVEIAAKKLRQVAETGEHHGAFGGEEMEACAQVILRLRDAGTGGR